VRVVIVTYSPGPTLAMCLASLGRALSVPYEVVLADNGSTDGAPEAAIRPGGETAPVRLLRMPANLGYGVAANAGARNTESEWILVTNPDVVFEPGAVDEMIAAGGRWPRAGSVGPAILTPDGAVYPSARSVPHPVRGVAHAALGWWWTSNPWTVAYRRERSELAEHACDWLSGSCLLVRSAAWRSVGGFDPGYFMYFEDLDLGERLGGAGWLNVYAPTARVTHEGGHATSRQSARMAAAHHDSAYRYVSRRWPGWRAAPFRLVVRFGLAARLALTRALNILGSGKVATRSREHLPDSSSDD